MPSPQNRRALRAKRLQRKRLRCVRAPGGKRAVRDGETPGSHAAWAFFVDFDGTITDIDGFDFLVRHFAGEEVWYASERALGRGRESLRDLLARQTSYIRGNFEDVYAVHERAIRIDPTFAPFVARCEAAGFPVTIVSSGIGPLIRRRLAEADLGHLPVVASDVEIAESGWMMRFVGASPNGTDKAALVRGEQQRGVRVAYLGDGESDFDAALCADRRFAKRGRSLERYLRERRVAFEAFSTFDEVSFEVPLTRDTT